jgi:hypothetical protein
MLMVAIMVEALATAVATMDMALIVAKANLPHRPIFVEMTMEHLTLLAKTCLIKYMEMVMR